LAQFQRARSADTSDSKPFLPLRGRHVAATLIFLIEFFFFKNPQEMDASIHSVSRLDLDGPSF